MIKKILILHILFVVLFVSCTSKSTLDDFTYNYSMESVNNFKIEFQLNSDATFKITQYNFFFDNFEKTRRPVSSEGTLNNQEFSRFKTLLQESELEEMKDSYGFEENKISESDIMYMIELKQNDISKFVSINSSEILTFPKKFNELISYTNTIISDKHQVE